MGKNKSGPKNAYYYFMCDFKQGRNLSMAEASVAASPHWQRLSAEERKPYEEKAKQEKNNQKVVKYTTAGIQISVVERQEQEQSMKQMNMREQTDQTIRNAVVDGTIAEQPFYIIHVNYFCHCSPNHYVPAELAVCKFTLRDGVTPENIFHAIIKPGKIPLGYTFDAKKHAEETHQLMIPDEDEPNNFNETIRGLLKFLELQNTRNKPLPPLYTIESNIPVAESVLQNLCATYCYDEGLFKVYPLDYMFYALRNGVNENRPYPTISLSKLELEKDVYDFCKSIPCNYHQVSDVRNFCSRSYVIRLAYIICDNCCGDLGINLIPGQHIPTDSLISAVSRPVSRASGWTSSQTTDNETYQSDLSDVENLSIADTNDMDNYSIPDSTDSHTVVNDTDDNQECEWTSYRPRNKRSARNTPRSNAAFNSEQNPSASSKETARRPRQFSAALTGMFPGSSSLTPTDLSGNLIMPSTSAPSEAGSIADTYRTSRYGTSPTPSLASSFGGASSNGSIKSSPPKRMGGAFPLVSGRGRGQTLQNLKR